jgi:uncharacterized protein
MKFLLVLAVVLVAVWIWRNNRRQDTADRSRPAPRPAPPRPANMVACAQCAMHLPEAEAVAGRRGVYCCHEHRRQAEEAVG